MLIVAVRVNEGVALLVAVCVGEALLVAVILAVRDAEVDKL